LSPPELVDEAPHQRASRGEPVPRLRVGLLDRVDVRAEGAHVGERGLVGARVDDAVELPPADGRLAGQSHAQVSGARLHDDAARAEHAALDGVGDEGAGCAVLGAAAGVEGLEFGPDPGVPAAELGKGNERRAADSGEQAGG